MRTLILSKAVDASELATMVVDRRSSDPAAALDRIKDLNPHVDFRRMKAGTVLILPDDAALGKSRKDAEAVGGTAMRKFAAAAASGFETAAGRARTAADTSAADLKAVTDSLKSKLPKAQIESDPALRKQLDEATAASAGRQKALKEAAASIGSIQKTFIEELAAMKKLLM
jgi:hypothetical protein